MEVSSNISFFWIREHMNRVGKTKPDACIPTGQDAVLKVLLMFADGKIQPLLYFQQILYR